PVDCAATFGTPHAAIASNDSARPHRHAAATPSAAATDSRDRAQLHAARPSDRSANYARRTHAQIRSLSTIAGASEKNSSSSRYNSQPHDCKSRTDSKTRPQIAGTLLIAGSPLLNLRLSRRPIQKHGVSRLLIWQNDLR